MSFAINYPTIYPDAQNIQRFYFLNITLAGWKAVEKLDSGLQRLCTGILFLVELPNLKSNTSRAFLTVIIVVSDCSFF